MKINISDARRQLCGSACCRWALLKLDLCSITAILHPRLSSHPPLAVKQRERRRDDFIYTRRKPAASPRRRCRGDSAQERNGTERAKGKRRGKETKEKRESRTKGGAHSIARRCVRVCRAIYFEFYISRARRISARSLRFPRRARPVHSRGTTATWIISIFALAKVSRRDYRDATRFHPRREGNGG